MKHNIYSAYEDIVHMKHNIYSAYEAEYIWLAGFVTS